MYTGKMDLLTLMLYMMLGVVAAVCVSKAQRADGTVTLWNKVSLEKWMIFFGIFVLVFTFFAAFRGVGENLGGADAYNYQQIFLHSLDKDHELYMRIKEPLFRWYCRLVRLFTSSHQVFFLISYGFIAVSYCVFIRKFCVKGVSYIPFLLLIFPYLKAYCTLRTSMAVAVCLLSWVYWDKNRWVSIALAAASVFVHRMSIAYAVFLVFDLLLGKHIRKLNGWRLAVLIFGISFAGVWVARGLQWVLTVTNLLGSEDTSYLQWFKGRSLFSRVPMYFAHMLLYIALVCLGGRVRDTKKWSYIKRFCCYDIIVMPATLILTFWRANEYMYVARLIMWGMLIPEGEQVFVELVTKNKWLKGNEKLGFLRDAALLRLLFRAGVACVFAFWLLFRIYSEWDDLKIMPYVLDVF